MEKKRSAHRTVASGEGGGTWGQKGKWIILGGGDVKRRALLGRISQQPKEGRREDSCDKRDSGGNAKYYTI